MSRIDFAPNRSFDDHNISYLQELPTSPHCCYFLECKRNLNLLLLIGLFSHVIPTVSSHSLPMSGNKIGQSNMASV